MKNKNENIPLDFGGSVNFEIKKNIEKKSKKKSISFPMFVHELFGFKCECLKHIRNNAKMNGSVWFKDEEGICHIVNYIEIDQHGNVLLTKR